MTRPFLKFDAPEDLPQWDPHNIEAEQALLGAILINNEALDLVSDIVDPGHFYEPLHSRIYDACRKHYAAGNRATPITIKSYFVKEPPVGDLSISEYLGRLAGHATTVINARGYAETVRDLSLRRDLARIGEEMAARARSMSLDDAPQQQIELAEKHLYQLGQFGERQGTQIDVGGATDKALAAAADAFQRGTSLCGLSTGIVALDNMIGGLMPENVIVLAGRPSMGKTALGETIAHNVASAALETVITADGEAYTKGCPVGFLSMEMSDTDLGFRSLAAASGISGAIIRRGQFDDDQFTAMTKAAAGLHRIPLYFDTAGGLTPEQVRKKARNWVRTKKIGLLIVDYLQLMTVKGVTDDFPRVSQAMAVFKPLAKELGIPIIVLSQLSRGPESREDKRPNMGDLRSSGNIEQDADVVLFVFREEYYAQQKEPPLTKPEEHQKWMAEMEACAGIAEVIQAKGRHQGAGKARVRFNGAITRFEDI